MSNSNSNKPPQPEKTTEKNEDYLIQPQTNQVIQTSEAGVQKDIQRQVRKAQESPQKLSEIEIRKFLMSLDNPYQNIPPDAVAEILKKTPIILICDDIAQIRTMMTRFFTAIYKTDPGIIQVFKSGESLVQTLRLESPEEGKKLIYPPQKIEESAEDYKKYLQSLAGGIILSDNDMGPSIKGKDLAGRIKNLKESLGMTFFIFSGDSPQNFTDVPGMDLYLDKMFLTNEVKMQKLARTIQKTAAKFWQTE